MIEWSRHSSLRPPWDHHGRHHQSSSTSITLVSGIAMAFNHSRHICKRMSPCTLSSHLVGANVENLPGFLLGVSIQMCIYIYREREREREFYSFIYVYVYIHIYIYICVCVCVCVCFVLFWGGSGGGCFWGCLCAPGCASETLRYFEAALKARSPQNGNGGVAT